MERKRNGFFAEGLLFIRDVFGHRTPVVRRGLNKEEWIEVRTAKRERLLEILATHEVRVYNGYPLVVLDDDELRDCYALVVLNEQRLERSTSYRDQMKRYVERLKRTQVLP